MVNKINAVVYARYSSSGQTEQSIEGQLRDAYEYAEREGYTIIHEYIDRARTGKNDNRDDFQKMLTDSVRKRFSVVIVWKLDRFARNRYDSAVNKAKLKKNGVRVVSVKESITDTPEGIILEGMLESMAEYYSANLSVNVKRGLRETMLKGKYCGGFIPFGYKLENGRLVPDERTAPIAREIFQRYASGERKADILADLKKRGIKSPKGKDLTQTSYGVMLKNRIYIGEYIRGSFSSGDAVDPIIPEDIFRKCQLRLKENKRKTSKASVSYLLQGKVFCGMCGERLFGESARGRHGEIHRYYTCYGRHRHTCTKKRAGKDMVEDYVVSCTVEQMLIRENIEKIATAVIAQYQDDYSVKRIDETERAIARIDADLNKLVDALIDAPKSTHSRLYEKMDQLEKRKADMEQDLNAQRIALSYALTRQDVISWLNSFTRGDQSSDEYRARLIDTLVNSVYIYDDMILVFYNVVSPPPPQPTCSDPITPMSDASSSTAPSSASSASSPSSGSSFNVHALPSDLKSEPLLTSVRGVVGFLFHFL